MNPFYYLFIHLSVHLFKFPLCLLIHPFIYPFIHLSIHSSIYLSIHPLSDPAVSVVQVNTDTVSDGSSQTIIFGQEVILTCTFTDTDSTSSVQWSLDGASIPSNMISTVSDVSNSTLNLTSFITAGVYRCMVSNDDGRTAQASVQLYGNLNSK